MNNRIEGNAMRIETVREVIKLVTHSLNNHVSGMYGMAQLAAATGNPEYSAKTAEIAHESCGKIKLLIQEFSLFTCDGSPVRTGAELKRIVETVCVILDREMEKKKITVNVDIDASLRFDTVSGDLRNLLFCLLRSSVDSAPGSDTISFSAEQDADEIRLKMTDSDKEGLLSRDAASAARCCGGEVSARIDAVHRTVLVSIPFSKKQ